ncbi:MULTISPECIES: hypothetical protein [Cupriavidus]
MSLHDTKRRPTPGKLWLPGVTGQIKVSERRPAMVAIDARVMDSLRELPALLHPKMTCAVFQSDDELAGARLLMCLSDRNAEDAAMGNPVDDPLERADEDTWFGPDGVAYVPYESADAQFEVLVWRDGSFQLRWDALDHPLGECPLDSDFFTLADLQRVLETEWFAPTRSRADDLEP